MSFREVLQVLYLASLRGGAFVEGFSSVSKNTIINDQSIIKSDSKILDFNILSENKNKDHYEIKLLAIIGSKNNSFECKKKPINISIFILDSVSAIVNIIESF